LQAYHGKDDNDHEKDQRTRAGGRGSPEGALFANARGRDGGAAAAALCRSPQIVAVRTGR